MAEGIAKLDEKDAWQRWLSMASKLHRYSFNNVTLTMLQKPDATMIAGYRAWQAMGHQVRRGEKAIKILGPVTRKVELVDRATGEPIRDAEGRLQYVRQMIGVRPVSVFDASQVDPPVQTPPEPTPAARSGSAGPVGLAGRTGRSRGLPADSRRLWRRERVDRLRGPGGSGSGRMWMTLNRRNH